jgi:DNA polymerase-4
MQSTILHVAIDSFAIQAERLRCPKLVGRPLALAPSDSPRPRVVAVSREARAAGITPGTPLLVARRLCRDLIALPPDPDLYFGLSDTIRGRLSPYAPMEGVGGATPKAGRFVLDLTGIARGYDATRDRAARAGREVEQGFGLHPTLGLAATRLVSGIAASVLAPDGELLEVRAGSEAAFLGPLAVRVLPASRLPLATSRLDLLNVRQVRDVQALTVPQMEAAFGAVAAVALWRESRGLDAPPARAAEAPPSAIAEETLAAETNDRRILVARLERLAVEVGTGLRARGAAARRLAVAVTYVDGRGDRAQKTPREPVRGERAIRAIAIELLDRAVTRRVRVRRLRLEAWEGAAVGTQLSLWGPAEGPGAPARALALESAVHTLRSRFGTEAVVPAHWMALGVARGSSL